MRRLTFILISLLLLASCGSDRCIKLGNEAMYIGEYYEASLQYARAYAKIPSKEREKRGEIAYKVGESNRLCNYTTKALAAYRNAARYKYTDTLTYFYMAEMERIAKDYKNAVLHYEEFLKTNPGDKRAIIGIQSCAAAPLWKEEGSSYTVKEDKLFNGRYDDFCPVISGDQIFITSSRKEAEGDEISGITGMKYGDLFVAAKDENGKWKKLEPVGTGVNTNYDEGACCFNPDGTKMYFTRCRWDATYPRLAEIFCSTRADAKWSDPQQCVLSHDTLTSYAHPAISPDGRYMYFVSNMPGGQGGLDIWRAEIMGDGFGMMENLGPEINTAGDEMFPTFRPNGDLYFSTNGKVGMGGLDIYKATPDTTATHYWKVEHLPYPVNSNGDDFGMTFEGEHNRGYFSSNRSNRRGWDKIFSFDCPEIIQTVKGWVYEQDGYELPQAIVYMVGDDGTNQKLNLQLDGSFQVQVQPNVRYLFLATCDGYLNYNQMYNPGIVTESEEDTLQFPLPSIVMPVLVHNVFYEFDKANITPESKPALDALTNLLKQNPTIAIELSAHCDYRGSDDYNKRLSQQRAEAVVKYLTTHGIAPGRLTAKGYGKGKPKVITGKFAEKYPFLHAGDSLSVEFIQKLPKGQQDTCNALNRRTEFTVTKTTYGLLDEKEILEKNRLLKQLAEKKAGVKKASGNKKQTAKKEEKKDTVAIKETVSIPLLEVAKPDTTLKTTVEEIKQEPVKKVEEQKPDEIKPNSAENKEEVVSTEEITNVKLSKKERKAKEKAEKAQAKAEKTAAKAEKAKPLSAKKALKAEEKAKKVQLKATEKEKKSAAQKLAKVQKAQADSLKKVEQQATKEKLKAQKLADQEKKDAIKRVADAKKAKADSIKTVAKARAQAKKDRIKARKAAIKRTEAARKARMDSLKVVAKQREIARKEKAKEKAAAKKASLKKTDTKTTTDSSKKVLTTRKTTTATKSNSKSSSSSTTKDSSTKSTSTKTSTTANKGSTTKKAT